MLCPTAIFLFIRATRIPNWLLEKSYSLSLVKKMAMVQRWPGPHRKGGGLDVARAKGQKHLPQVSRTLKLGEPEKAQKHHPKENDLEKIHPTESQQMHVPFTRLIWV